MKMKKLVALGAAAAMSMTMCVNVFAESEVKNAVNAGYAGAQASYTGTISAADGTQMTVVVLKAIAQDATLSNDDIEYINQDVAASALYTNMGTKTDLLAVGEDGTATYAGDYVIRVGYYDAEGAWNVAEGTFTIATAQTEEGPTATIIWGDVNADGAVSVLDASAVLNRAIGGNTTFTDADGKSFTIGNEYAPIIWGDVNADGSVSVLDASAVLNRAIGGNTTFTDSNDVSYTISDEYTVSYVTE